MAIDFKEYTKYRDIAQKRIKRAIAAGVPLYIHVPTVKELRQVGEGAQEIEMMRLRQFLETGFSLSSRKKKERAKISDEERKARRREQQREYRRKKVARELETIPNKYQGYLKGIKKLGVDIPPSKLPAFFAYMDYRFAQGKASKKYVFDIFVEDFQKMLQKGYSANQIVNDFRQFEADQALLADRADAMQGTSYERAISLWDEFIERV